MIFYELNPFLWTNVLNKLWLLFPVKILLQVKNGIKGFALDELYGNNFP